MAREIKRKSKRVKDPLNFKYKMSRLPKGRGNMRGGEKNRKEKERKIMREYNEK